MKRRHNACPRSHAIASAPNYDAVFELLPLKTAGNRLAFRNELVGLFTSPGKEGPRNKGLYTRLSVITRGRRTLINNLKRAVGHRDKNRHTRGFHARELGNNFNGYDLSYLHTHVLAVGTAFAQLQRLRVQSPYPTQK